MSQTVPAHYGIQFANTIELLLQQKDSRLGDKVSVASNYSGKQVSPVDQVGILEMDEVTSRFEPMGRKDIPLDRRWVVPQSYDLNQQLDSYDDHKLLIDPKSKYVQAGYAAAKRRRDRTIINAFFADAKTGEQGGTTTSFLSSQQIAVNFGSASNVNLTYAKVKEARRLFMAADVDTETEELFIGVTDKEHDSLLNEIQLISLDYNDRPVLQEGKITRFLGFNFVHSQLFKSQTDGSGYYRIPAWVKSGMHLAIWKDLETDISKRNDIKGTPWQAYLKLMIGATRLEEKKVVEIKCL